MRRLRTTHGMLLAVGIFCFLLGVAAATAGPSAFLGLASVALLTIGAITVTWGAILAFRRRG